MPAAKVRKVELLANTPYSIERESKEEVVLRDGRNLERWRRAEVPAKGYALLINGQEYEFDCKLIG
jgi:hypothetical protein